MAVAAQSIGDLITEAQADSRRAVGRLLSLVEAAGDEADEVTELTYRLAGKAHVIGITGAPGSGKSTLTGRLIALLVERGRCPAVLAVDPSSPLSGGAILGDRIRMDRVDDERVFIRSMATRGHAGGLALAVPGAVRVLDAAGFDPVIIETVGVGQVEVDVARTADTTVVVVPPGAGDAVQANKAGLLELADVFVVNKADRPGSDETRRDLSLMLDLSHVSGQEARIGQRPPVLTTDALAGTGVAELADAIDEHWRNLHDTDRFRDRRRDRLRSELTSRLEQRLIATIDELLDGDGAGIAADAESGRISPAAASDALLGRLLD